MQWQLIDCDGGRYSIRIVRRGKYASYSRTGHPDGERVQSSKKRELWVIEEGPGDRYRCGILRRVLTEILKLYTL